MEQSRQPTLRFGKPLQAPLASSTRDGRDTVVNVAPAIADDESLVARWLGGLATASIFMLFFGLPVFFTGVTFQGLAFDKQLYFYVWLLLGLVAWVSRGMMIGELKIRRTFLDIPIALFVFAYILSAFFSVDQWHSFWGGFNDPSRGVLNILALTAAYYLILSHFSPRRLYLWLTGLLASFVLVLVWSTLALFGVHFLPRSLELVAPLSLLGNIGTLMLFIGGLIPLAVLGIVKLAEAPASWYKWPGIGILTVALVLAFLLLLPLYEYVSWPALFLGLGLFVIFVLAQIVRFKGGLSFLPMIALVIVMGFFMIGQVNVTQVRLPIEVTPNLKLSSHIAKESLKNQFFLGSGPATYAYDFALFKHLDFNQSPLFAVRFTQGSGLLFEALPTTGVIGTILFIVLILAFLSFGLYFLMHNKEVNKVYSLGLWSSAAVFLVGALLIPVNSTLIILGVLVGTLALGTLFWESRADALAWRLSLKVSPKFALVLAFIFLVVSAGVVFCFAFLGKAWLADMAVGRALRASAVTPETSARLGQATQYMPHESRYFSLLGQVHMSLANQEATKEEGRDLEKLKGWIESATRLLLIGRNMAGNDILAQELLAQGYENTLLLAGAAPKLLDPLEQAYERGVELEPNNPVFHLKLGQIQKVRAASAKPEEQARHLTRAKGHFERALALKRNYVPASVNLALLQEAADKDRTKALATLETAATYDPQNQDIRYHLARLYRLRAGTGDLERAETMFKELAAVNDQHVNAYLNLGLIYEKTNRTNEAIAAYEKVKGLFTGDDRNVETARQEVQKLIENVRAGRPNNLDQAPVTPKESNTPPPDGFPAPAPTPAPDSNTPPVTAPATPTNQ